ncbi:MAG TPA: FAD-binding oxidoreductase [Polyangia bacterium]|nr:FAD-binding oxidoreductase [Polyangia bacterium]
MPPSTSEIKSGPLTATLSSRTSLGAGVVDLVFTMREPAHLHFLPGQFVSIQIGEVAGVAKKRSYSIASPSDAGDRLRFVIRTIPDGAATDFLLTLSVGAEVRMTGPHGFFVLDADHPGDIVFGATGTGLAAVMPMLGEMARRPKLGRRQLYWGARHREDLFAREEIAELCRRADTELHEVLSAPPADWSGGRGRITQALVDLLPSLNQPTFYLVGNGAMIGDVKRELMARGVDRKRQIRTEAFFD